MKADLAPAHNQKIGINNVLWFERSNSYVVISEMANNFLNAFIKAKDKNQFKLALKKDFDLSFEVAESYYLELSNFLDNLNYTTENTLESFVPESIPSPNISKTYRFGDSFIEINFSDVNLVSLIHPYLQHSSVEQSNHLETTFDIFCDNEQLYLFKNKSFIGNYKKDSFHFLQGKFAMELVCSIYENTEVDWLATFHASTICNEKEAIMIIGDSGNGKSTLSAVLMAHGFDLLADDFTPMLAENQHLYRFPAAISIKKGAFSTMNELYSGFNEISIEKSNSKPVSVKYLPPTSSFSTSKKHFECQKIVMVKYDPTIPSKLEECTSEKMLQTFIPDSWISPNTDHSKIFLNWLTNVKFFELTYSDNEFAIKSFNELFNK